MVFISWQHYIDKKKRILYKKQTGVSINGFGEKITKKDEFKNTNLNTLILKNTDISLKKKDDTKYKSISKYKPTGNLIYNTSLLKTIQDELK